MKEDETEFILYDPNAPKKTKRQLPQLTLEEKKAKRREANRARYLLSREKKILESGIGNGDILEHDLKMKRERKKFNPDEYEQFTKIPDDPQYAFSLKEQEEYKDLASPRILLDCMSKKVYDFNDVESLESCLEFFEKLYNGQSGPIAWLTFQQFTQFWILFGHLFYLNSNKRATTKEDYFLNCRQHIASRGVRKPRKKNTEVAGFDSGVGGDSQGQEDMSQVSQVSQMSQMSQINESQMPKMSQIDESTQLDDTYQDNGIDPIITSSDKADHGLDHSISIPVATTTTSLITTAPTLATPSASITEPQQQGAESQQSQQLNQTKLLKRKNGHTSCKVSYGLHVNYDTHRIYLNRSNSHEHSHPEDAILNDKLSYAVKNYLLLSCIERKNQPNVAKIQLMNGFAFKASLNLQRLSSLDMREQLKVQVALDRFVEERDGKKSASGSKAKNKSKAKAKSKSGGGSTKTTADGDGDGAENGETRETSPETESMGPIQPLKFSDNAQRRSKMSKFIGLQLLEKYQIHNLLREKAKYREEDEFFF
ncbi:unnamed protein product [Ambrosiozyma monospora]|uniref:Unnamed protein product n=1 Tax=Ambrosiozyma monospora TaxID=43982 RepID=A0A9W6Z0H2_AMBMO|nr:unnamed protein product [Ambrosiozyma monospora]